MAIFRITLDVNLDYVDNLELAKRIVEDSINYGEWEERATVLDIDAVGRTEAEKADKNGNRA